MTKSTKIKIIDEADHQCWDAYVRNHPSANLYHVSGWKTVIEKTYNHNTYYLMATVVHPSKLNKESQVVGILPLVHMRHFVFGNKLVSIPFFDMGGILADNDHVAAALLDEAIALGRKLGVKSIEIRQTQSHHCLNSQLAGRTNQTSTNSKTNKVRMLLDLPGTSDELLKSFKSKLRSQIKRPQKEGLVAQIGGKELIDDFYKMFCVNMRDLGSPVHSKKIMDHVLEVFAKTAQIVLILKDGYTVAGSIIIGFQDTLENPWASSLRKYSRLSPNMLLYWTMLAYACDNGYRSFDFGRSTPGEGTYKFKKQWGATAEPLNWKTISLSGESQESLATDRSKFQKAISFWQKLPVPMANVLGPILRKHIEL